MQKCVDVLESDLGRNLPHSTILNWTLMHELQTVLNVEKYGPGETDLQCQSYSESHIDIDQVVILIGEEKLS